MKARSEKNTLKEIVDTIVESSHPQKIVLFGSRAKKTHHQESDYDFMIIKQGVKNEREVSRQIRKALFNKKIRLGIDLVVIDSEKLKTHKDNSYLIYFWALKEGKILYG